MSETPSRELSEQGSGERSECGLDSLSPGFEPCRFPVDHVGPCGHKPLPRSADGGLLKCEHREAMREVNGRGDLFEFCHECGMRRKMNNGGDCRWFKPERDFMPETLRELQAGKIAEKEAFRKTREAIDRYERRDDVCSVVNYPAKWRERVRNFLFPQPYAMTPETDFEIADVVDSRTFLNFSLADRVKILFTGRVFVEVRTATENEVGRTKSTSIVSVLPPACLEGVLK